MKLFALIAVVLLSGCVATPVKREFPKLPSSLTEPCENLSTVPSTTKLSDVLIVVTENYSRYQQCKIKNELWLDWYNQQKKIFDSVK